MTSHLHLHTLSSTRVVTSRGSPRRPCDLDVNLLDKRTICWIKSADNGPLVLFHLAVMEVMSSVRNTLMTIFPALRWLLIAVGGTRFRYLRNPKLTNG